MRLDAPSTAFVPTLVLAVAAIAGFAACARADHDAVHIGDELHWYRLRPNVSVVATESWTNLLNGVDIGVRVYDRVDAPAGVHIHAHVDNATRDVVMSVRADDGFVPSAAALGTHVMAVFNCYRLTYPLTHWTLAALGTHMHATPPTSPCYRRIVRPPCVHSVQVFVYASSVVYHTLGQNSQPVNVHKGAWPQQFTQHGNTVDQPHACSVAATDARAVCTSPHSLRRNVAQCAFDADEAAAYNASSREPGLTPWVLGTRAGYPDNRFYLYGQVSVHDMVRGARLDLVAYDGAGAAFTPWRSLIAHAHNCCSVSCTRRTSRSATSPPSTATRSSRKTPTRCTSATSTRRRCKAAATMARLA